MSSALQDLYWQVYYLPPPVLEQVIYRFIVRRAHTYVHIHTHTYRCFVFARAVCAPQYKAGIFARHSVLSRTTNNNSKKPARFRHFKIHPTYHHWDLAYKSVFNVVTLPYTHTQTYTGLLLGLGYG